MINNDNMVCDICCTSIKTTDIKTINWDWFKGYLERTYHYCPKHKDTETAQKKLMQSKKPAYNAKLTGKPPCGTIIQTKPS
jgi:hypothetical protein